MASEPVGTCTDNYGDLIELSTEDGDVRVAFNDGDAEHSLVMMFDAERRDEFIKLWAEAERRAEACKPEVSGG